MHTFSKNANRIEDIKTGVESEEKSDVFLKFVLDPQTIGLLESEFVQEVLTVKATQIMPVPNKPSCILGILSRRRRVYWSIDLAMLLGLQPLNQNIGLYEVILTSVQEFSLALIVPSILGVYVFPAINLKMIFFLCHRHLDLTLRDILTKESRFLIYYEQKIFYSQQSYIHSFVKFLNRSA